MSVENKMKERPGSKTPGYKILYGCRDALFGTLSYVWWKFVRSSTKSFENTPLMGDVEKIISQRRRENENEARTRLRINEYWGKNSVGYQGNDKMENYEKQPENPYCISGAIERYEAEIKDAKVKILKAIQEIVDGVEEELEILKGLLTNKGEGQQDASD